MSPTGGIFGVIPAAGRAGRMGSTKQLLDVGGTPMVIGVAEALLAGGAQGVVLVVAPRLGATLASLLPPGARLAINPKAHSEMIDSIRIGLDAAPAPAGYMICPCDAAGIDAQDVRRCAAAFTNSPECIIIASHGGRRGHPVIFPASLAPVVRSRECDAGLNQLARNRPQLVRLVECDSPGTVQNVNTPEDYRRLGDT